MESKRGVRVSTPHHSTQQDRWYQRTYDPVKFLSVQGLLKGTGWGRHTKTHWQQESKVFSEWVCPLVAQGHKPHLKSMRTVIPGYFIGEQKDAFGKFPLPLRCSNCQVTNWWNPLNLLWQWRRQVIPHTAQPCVLFLQHVWLRTSWVFW